MILPRPEVITLTEAQHGFGLSANPCAPSTPFLDFSANTNPFPLPAAVIEAIRNVPINCYPDREASTLRRCLSARLGVDSESIIAANGSSELLYFIALAYLRPHDSVLVVGPTYAEYARVSALMGARVIECNAVSGTGFRPPEESLEAALKHLQPRAVFLCNPNNPTGQTVSASLLQRWIAGFPKTLFIVDEAYIEFSEPAETLLPNDRDNLIVLRSLTKAFGLAGLRLGYAVSHPEVIRVLARVRPPWSVNAAAQAAGVAVLTEMDDIMRSIGAVRAEAKALISTIEAMGVSVIPARAQFFLIRVRTPQQVMIALHRAGILVRDCTSFGLHRFLRISPRCSADNAVLSEVLKRLSHHF
jgi:histidinol-phosphate aminotransferase